MDKIIEKAAEEYASAIEPDRLGRGDLESAFEAGADYIMNLPLYARLTDEERITIIGMYDVAVSKAAECEDQHSFDWNFWIHRLSLLTRIFGIELFNKTTNE